MKQFFLIGFFWFLLLEYSFSQVYSTEPQFTAQDTLRGSVTRERSWWDVTYYHLDVRVYPADSAIYGSNTIQYRVIEGFPVMQIDLQPPLNIFKVEQDGKSLQFARDGNAYFIHLIKKQVAGNIEEIVVHYGGEPKVAFRPPWDGGITWTQDENGYPFVASSCQGLGASVWWPNKDHLYDEPDSMLISVNTPGSVMDVSNGRLRKVDHNFNGTKTWHWFVSNPISNYGVNINIGDYVHYSELYRGEKGTLDMDYYVLRTDYDKAVEQFKEAPRMMKAFEYWFGPYPFYEDGYKLVQAPYLGMEHQSSVTYGNGFGNGYRGMDLSGSGWGLKFDFIIVHESAHEWFANNITIKDIADMWIHESFANYAESLFLEYHFGKAAANEYVLGTRLNILNDRPVIGLYDVNYAGSGDMYYKGGNMLHTLRQVMNDDIKWRETLRGLNRDFYHQTVTTIQIEDYLSKALGRELKPFFDQYLRDVRIPTLEYAFREGKLTFRWTNTVEDFNMPVKVYVRGNPLWIYPITKWRSVRSAGKELTIDPNFYVAGVNLLGTIEKTGK